MTTTPHNEGCTCSSCQSKLVLKRRPNGHVYISDAQPPMTCPCSLIHSWRADDPTPVPCPLSERCSHKPDNLSVEQSRLISSMSDIFARIITTDEQVPGRPGSQEHEIVLALLHAFTSGGQEAFWQSYTALENRHRWCLKWRRVVAQEVSLWELVERPDRVLVPLAYASGVRTGLVREDGSPLRPTADEAIPEQHDALTTH